MTKHVFIIGSKGIPASYGGFETFVDRLVEKRKNTQIQYHVACMGEENRTFEYLGAECFQLPVPKIGPARAVYYDIMALRASLRSIRAHHWEDAVIYVLACRIGPWIGYYKRKLHKSGVRLFVNPDGHEWLRAKWSPAIRRYWKFSERLMVKHADLLICDSKNIELYIQQEYAAYTPKTTYIAYGADVEPGSSVSDVSAHTGEEQEQEEQEQEKQEQEKQEQEALKEWYQMHAITPQAYYLVVGRFVPENNYETMLREFIASKTTKDLVLITNAEQNAFYDTLVETTDFKRDKRIKFVGTVYDAGMLNHIRRDAFAYLHGHEVGGTNPSLLEALSMTDVNLLLDVGFNREVAEQGALYWHKEIGDLTRTLAAADAMTASDRQALGQLARQRIREHYSWDGIVQAYETLFMTGDIL
ncbi:MAG: DUF1972 domain-containing protein [Lachnospiraceae bacterium]